MLPDYMDVEPRSRWPLHYYCYVALFLGLFLLLGLTSIFKLLPDQESAAVQCHLTNLTLDTAIAEYAIGHTKRDSLTLFLYTTILTRVLQCRYLRENNHDHDMTFIYQQYYLNISHVDVEGEMTLLKKRHEKPLFLWKYDVENESTLREHTAVDQYGLSDHPIDNDTDSLRAWFFMKCVQALASLLLVSLVVAIQKIYTKHRLAIHYWATRLCPPGNNSGNVIYSLSSRHCV